MLAYILASSFIYSHRYQENNAFSFSIISNPNIDDNAACVWADGSSMTFDGVNGILEVDDTIHINLKEECKTNLTKFELNNNIGLFFLFLI